MAAVARADEDPVRFDTMGWAGNPRWGVHPLPAKSAADWAWVGDGIGIRLQRRRDGGNGRNPANAICSILSDRFYPCRWAGVQLDGRRLEVVMSAKATLLGAIAWACGFLVSAVVLKGNPLGDWIDGALLVGWIVFISMAGWSAANRRKSGSTP